MFVYIGVWHCLFIMYVVCLQVWLNISLTTPHLSQAFYIVYKMLQNMAPNKGCSNTFCNGICCNTLYPIPSLIVWSPTFHASVITLTRPWLHHSILSIKIGYATHAIIFRLFTFYISIATAQYHTIPNHDTFDTQMSVVNNQRKAPIVYIGILWFNNNHGFKINQSL